MEITNSGKTKKKVFLITNRKSNDILLNLLKGAPFISEVRIGSPNVIKQFNELFLTSYDCIIYDIIDSGFKIKIENEDEIKNYIENDGGSFLVTHDQWDNVQSGGPLNLIGLEHFYNFPWVISDEVKCETHPKKHEIYKSYYDLTNLGVMKIAPTHKTCHIIKEGGSAKVILSFIIDKTTNYLHDYLVVNELGKGRIAYWAAGHSNTISKDEEKIFLNIVAWLTQY